MNHKITIQDVAVLADVSSATVSHVFNKTRYVSPEKVEKVLNAAKALRYTPNSYAKSFRTGKKNLIGFIVPDISNRFFATIIEAVETTLSTQGYRLVVANTKETPSRELEHLSYFCSGVVDGLLISSTLKSFDEINHYLTPSLPVLFVDRKFEDAPYCSATITSTSATYQVTIELIRSGHRQIGYVAGLPHLSTTNNRIQGYLAALKDAHIEVQDSWIAYGNSMEKSAEECVETLVKQNCTAILISNGTMSLDTANYLYRHYNSSDKKIDAVYFSDDYVLEMAPSFATITQPSFELGKNAAEQILRLIDAPDQAINHIILSSTFSLTDKAYR